MELSIMDVPIYRLIRDSLFLIILAIFTFCRGGAIDILIIVVRHLIVILNSQSISVNPGSHLLHSVVLESWST